ncbi:CDP-alcohol phosphatidyltransferase [Microbacterium sp. 22242]|uniref:CDP-alcohol phosphatidyltransferase n=1 Tax=Microbacterium sp. 22242 TaxID=3453896 RepID=UPI003F829357
MLLRRGSRPLPGQVDPRRTRPAVTAAAIAMLIVVPLLPRLLASPEGSAGSAGLIGVPVESLLILLLLVIVSGRILPRVLAGSFGLLVTAAIVLAAIDRGFRAALGIPFVPTDWPQLGDAYGVAVDAVGPFLTDLALAAVVIAAVACAAGLAWAARHTAALVRARASGRTVLAAVTAAWLVAGVVVPPRPDVSLAADASLTTLGTAVSRTGEVFAARAAVARDVADDPFAGVPADRLLSGLRGKDVVIAFVESYGRVALEGERIAPGVTDVLRDGDGMLAAEGYTSRSAWLTSPTFGGRSWLAHATLQTGVWTGTQSAYDQVVASDRLSLARAFGRAGWRTVSDVPSDAAAWDVGTSFYRYGTLVDARDVGYRGPIFGYARIPDQYTLKHFADTELAGPHAPVMAEIDLVSSHTPWAPLPQLVPWEKIGDGSIYDPQPAQSEPAGTVWQDPKTVQRFYGQSVQYSLGSLLSFLGHVDDPNLVVIVLGDHQPAAIVSGADASHDVPVSVIARDPSVFAATAGWGWSPGLRPGDDAPIWRMDAFRDRLLAAFSPVP